jgi:flavin reductase (DIM6/NTAB) family NADH-FMN oxidoreductase RutF
MYSWTLITGDVPANRNAAQLRSALASFATGVCLITTVGPDGKREGMTVNSFASVSLAPPLVLWSIREDTRSAEVFLKARHYVIHVLAADQKELAMHFARPAPDKFAAFEDVFSPGLGGCPCLRESAARFECTAWSQHQEGDHSILVGRVDAFLASESSPLLFHAGRLGSMQDLAPAAVA